MVHVERAVLVHESLDCLHSACGRAKPPSAYRVDQGVQPLAIVASGPEPAAFRWLRRPPVLRRVGRSVVRVDEAEAARPHGCRLRFSTHSSAEMRLDKNV